MIHFHTYRKIARAIRPAFNALIVAALLASLLPPPTLTRIALNVLPTPLEPIADFTETLLPETATALAAPAESASAAPVYKPVAAPRAAPSLQTVGVCDADSNDLGGVVFRDFNSNGIRDTNEVGFDGPNNGPMTVTAYADNDATGIVQPIGADGTYVFDNLWPTTSVRLEFSGLPSYMQPSFAGTSTYSAVLTQRLTQPTCSANLAINNPADFCQNNPTTRVSCYENGASTGATGTAIVSFDYDESTSANKISEAQLQDIGSVWGLAYRRSTDVLYAGAFIKRHSGLGPSVMDGVYLLDYSGGTLPPAFSNLSTNGTATTNGGTIDLGSVCRGNNTNTCPADTGLGGISTDYELTTTNTDLNVDLDAFDKVGKAGYGDLDLSEDENTLWMVNLNQRALISVDLATVTIDQFLIDGLPGAPTCTGGLARPFGLSFNDGKGYVGVVCTAETSQTRSDLHAYVFSFEPANITNGLTQEVDFALDFKREIAGGETLGNQERAGDWQPWASNWTDTGAGETAGDLSYAQPIVSDIDFADDGSMIIAMMDRFGHQIGYNNYRAIASGGAYDHTVANQVRGNAAGDILYACKVGGSFVLEGDASGNCAVNDPGTATLPGVDQYTDDGPNGGGEYFYNDFFAIGGFAGFQGHYETSGGSIAVLPGSNQVIGTAYDPDTVEFTGNNDIFTAGTVTFNTATAAQENALRVVQDQAFTFGKAYGLGDLALACDAAPLEIGNYVWLDSDNDGAQDPSEAPIPSLIVELYKGGTLVASTTTDSNGEYYFSSNSVGNQTWTGDTGLISTTAYEVRIDTTQGVLAGYSLTTANAASGTALPDGADSDASDNGNDAAVISVTTGTAGQNDHSLDFGFAPPPPDIEIAKWVNTPPTVTIGSPISFTIRITNSAASTGPLTSLALSDTYDNNYLTFDLVADAAGPNPATNPTDSGTISWSNVLDYETTDNQLDPGEAMDIIVTFVAKSSTSGLAGGASTCDTANHTYNNASAGGLSACAEVPIDPEEAKLTLGDFIWHDVNNDGVQDGNEAGINGVLVNLYELDITNNRILASLITTTTATVGLIDGSYSFEAISGKSYEVEIDATNFDPGGALAGFVVGQNQPNITGSTVATRQVPLISVNDLDQDFGYYCRFDLALDKVVTDLPNIAPGDNVTFTITVYNQGVVTATNVVIADYIPTDFTLSGANAATWNGGSTGTVTHTLNATLTPAGTGGASATVDIVLTAGAGISGTYTNTAEISAFDSSVKDGNGDDLPDADSTPNTTDGDGAGESTDLVDDEINEDGNNGGDEDDHDPAVVTVTLTPVNPSLVVGKQFNGVGDYRTNETISFTIRITNTGDITLTTVPLEDRYSHAFITYHSANPPPTPGSQVDGLISWTNLLTSLNDTDGLGVDESVSVVVTFTTAADTTALPILAPCTQGGQAPNLARSQGASATTPAGVTPVPEDGDDTSCASVEILNPTAIQLEGRSISQASNGVRVRWSTVSELDITGFYIWKSSGVEAEVRSGELIVAERAGQSSGYSYEWLDAGTSIQIGDAYMLELVYSSGTTELVMIDVLRDIRSLYLPLIAR